MDSLKTLMDKKQYDLVIKLTENSNDSIALFYRLSALLVVGKSEDALNLIKTKRLILQNKLALLIKFHIEILCLLGRFDEAYSELKYYEDLPYESQEVEEILREMPKYTIPTVNATGSCFSARSSICLCPVWIMIQSRSLQTLRQRSR